MSKRRRKHQTRNLQKIPPKKSTSTILKERGNEAFQKGYFEKAIRFYSRAIDLDYSENIYKLYSNRSAAYNECGQYYQALQDANECIQLQSNWCKGYIRKAAALLSQNKTSEARAVYDIIAFLKLNMSSKLPFVSSISFVYLNQNERTLKIQIPAEIKQNILKYQKKYKIIASGNNDYGDLGIGDKQQLNAWTRCDQIEARCDHHDGMYINNNSLLVIDAKHNAYCAGYNECNRLGIEASFDLITEFRQIAVSKQAISASHGISDSVVSFIYCSDNTLYASGRNDYGQFGNGEKDDDDDDDDYNDCILSSVPIFWCKQYKLTDIQCTRKYSLFLVENGDLFICGDGYRLIPQLTHQNIKAVSVGYDHHLLLNEEGILDVYGLDIKKEVIQFLNDQQIQQISSGGYHGAVITVNNKCYTFGNNIHGECGNGERGDPLNDIAYLLPFECDDYITDISCGGFHNLLLTKFNNVYSFGNNESKQCHVLSDDSDILSPHLMDRKRELNISCSDLVIKILAMPWSSLIIIDPSVTYK